MKASRFSNSYILVILKQAEAGTRLLEKKKDYNGIRLYLGDVIDPAFRSFKGDTYSIGLARSYRRVQDWLPAYPYVVWRLPKYIGCIGRCAMSNGFEKFPLKSAE
ncbi:MAG: hypothetical protein FJY19_07710 [Bacteroidetes bacterium]|nr:hypothetical protein [Bacteroidota bacterium]